MTWIKAITKEWGVGLLAFLCASIGESFGAGNHPKSYRDVRVPPIELPQFHYQLFTLENGVRGVVVEDNEVPLVEFYFRFKAPIDPEKKVGLGQVASWVLRNGGSENYSGDSLNQILEYTASSLEIFSGVNELFIWGQFLKDNEKTIFTILRDLVQYPAYPSHTLELRRTMMLESIRQEDESPFSVGRREFSKLLYPNHPWGRQPTIQSVMAIDREDLIAFHKEVFTQDSVVLGFTGDITLQEAKYWSDYIWGSLEPPQKNKEVIPPPLSVTPQGVYYFPKDLPQAFIYIGHRTINYTDPRRIAAEVMNYIFGGGGFQSLLTKKVRVESGLAYSVGSLFTTPWEGEGQFRMAAQTRINQAGQTISLLTNLLRQFSAEGPSEEEFRRAREAMINSYVWDFESSREFLRRLVWLLSHNLPLDYYQNELTAYQSLTYEEVKRAARELLKPDSLIILVVGNRQKLDRPLEDFGTVYILEPSQ
ncbi:MAG: M16 family metallopeptidase [bacterium]